MKKCHQTWTSYYYVKPSQPKFTQSPSRQPSLAALIITQRVINLSTEWEAGHVNIEGCHSLWAHCGLYCKWPSHSLRFLIGLMHYFKQMSACRRKRERDKQRRKERRTKRGREKKDAVRKWKGQRGKRERGWEQRFIATHCNRYIVLTLSKGRNPSSHCCLGLGRRGKNKKKCKSSNYYPIHWGKGSFLSSHTISPRFPTNLNAYISTHTHTHFTWHDQ